MDDEENQLRAASSVRVTDQYEAYRLAMQRRNSGMTTRLIQPEATQLNNSMNSSTDSEILVEPDRNAYSERSSQQTSAD